MAGPQIWGGRGQVVQLEKGSEGSLEESLGLLEEER